MVLDPLFFFYILNPYLLLALDTALPNKGLLKNKLFELIRNPPLLFLSNNSWCLSFCL